MKPHTRLLLSGLSLVTLGAGLFCGLNPETERNAGTMEATLPRLQPPPSRSFSQTWPAGAKQGNHPGRSGHGASREPIAESHQGHPTPPPTWAEAKVHVDQVRARFDAGQRKMAAELYDKTRAARQTIVSGEAPTALIPGMEQDAAAELPPVIVPFDPQHPSLPAPLPAVLAEFPEAGGVTPEQQAGVNQLAEDFLEAVADPLADPTDPAYQKRWQQAQLTADQLFRLRYGDFAWMLRHNAAHREALGGHYGK